MNITEKLAALRGALRATEPSEKEAERFFKLAAEREQLVRAERVAADYAEATKHREKLADTDQEFVTLSERLGDTSGRRQTAWNAALLAADDCWEALRHQIDELAGQPVEIGGNEVEPPSARIHREAIIGWQTAVAISRPSSLRNTKAVVLDAAEIIEAAVADLGKIEGERAALVAAAATYQKTLSSKAP